MRWAVGCLIKCFFLQKTSEPSIIGDPPKMFFVFFVELSL